MRQLAEQSWFLLARVLGQTLRAGRYARVRVVDRDGELEVRKNRLLHAPLLVWLGEPLVRLLDTGVRVLPRREWEERERLVHRRLRGASIHIAGDGTLVLPHLRGRTLAALLEDAALDSSARQRSIELAVVALREFHHVGLTHGDAMAENVMVDVDAGVAHWFDFETVHDASRPPAWRRADDVRALLATCLLRTARGDVADTLGRVLDVYADEGVTRLVAASFTAVLQRPLVFHLGQAPLSLETYREIGRLLSARIHT